MDSSEKDRKTFKNCPPNALKELFPPCIHYLLCLNTLPYPGMIGKNFEVQKLAKTSNTLLHTYILIEILTA